MLAAADVRIGGSVYDSRKHFASDAPTWLTQAHMSSQLVIGNINRGESVNVFLDLVQTPKGESVAKSASMPSWMEIQSWPRMTWTRAALTCSSWPTSWLDRSPMSGALGEGTLRTPRGR